MASALEQYVQPQPVGNGMNFAPANSIEETMRRWKQDGLTSPDQVRAVNELMQSGLSYEDALGQYRQSAPFSGAPEFGLRGAQDAVRSGLGAALTAIDTGVSRGTEAAQAPIGAAQENLSPYTQAGGNSASLMADFSGANGPQAQEAAYQAYRESPGLQYALEQSEKAIKRNAAATGGLGGGNVQRALSENAIGFAQQDFNNYYNRLGQGAQQGLQANSVNANLAGNLGGILSNLNAQGASQAANAFTGAGNNMGTMRYNTGVNMANMNQSAANQLANLQSGQGVNLTNLYNTVGTNQANLQQGSGIANANQLSQLATLLANLSQGQGTNQAGIDAQIGQSKAAGIVDSAAGLRSGISDGIALAAQIPGMPGMGQAAGQAAGQFNPYASLDTYNWTTGNF